MREGAKQRVEFPMVVPDGFARGSRVEESRPVLGHAEQEPFAPLA